MAAAATQTSTEVATRELTAEQALVQRISGEAFVSQVARALPAGSLLPERFTRAASTALMANPDLAKLEEASLFNAFLRAAQDGLLPDGREAAIVAYGSKAQYVPMIGGYRKIAGEHGWSIRTVVVYANDEFAVEMGIDPRIRHIPVRPGAERGDRIAAYAVGAHGDGRREVEVMYADQIAKCRSKAKTHKVWDEWTDRMWEKTVGKALFEKLPIGELDERVARVIAAEDTTPEQATAAMYGERAELTPGRSPVDVTEGGAPATDSPRAETSGGYDQQAEAGDGPQPTAPASAPDPLPDEPDESPFQPPAGALDESTEALKAAADKAGDTVIAEGRNTGKLIKDASPRWISYACKSPDFVQRGEARAWARVYMPDVYEAAMADAEGQS